MEERSHEGGHWYRGLRPEVEKMGNLEVEGEWDMLPVGLL
jgi:hypothetical protein